MNLFLKGMVSQTSIVKFCNSCGSTSQILRRFLLWCFHCSRFMVALYLCGFALSKPPPGGHPPAASQHLGTLQVLQLDSSPSACWACWRASFCCPQARGALVVNGHFFLMIDHYYWYFGWSITRLLVDKNHHRPTQRTCTQWCCSFLGGAPPSWQVSPFWVSSSSPRSWQQRITFHLTLERWR